MTKIPFTTTFVGHRTLTGASPLSRSPDRARLVIESHA
jgi:hypothetical protein